MPGDGPRRRAPADRRPRRRRAAVVFLVAVALVGGGLLGHDLLSPPHPAGPPARTRPGARLAVPRTAVAVAVRTYAANRFGRIQVLTLQLGRPLGTRKVWVYRPSARDSPTLPVLYFLHGVPGTPADLFTEAHFVTAMDRYLAAGGRPFVVASLDGRSGRHPDTEWVDAVDGTDPIASLALGPELAAVEGSNRRDREHRALAGYSMGGYGAMNLAMIHPGMFGQVATIGGYFHVDDPDRMLGTAPATIAANSPDQHPTAARGLHILILDSTGDRDPTARGQTPAFAATLRAAHVPATETLIPGGHTWSFVTAAIPRMITFLAVGWAGDHPAA